MKIDGRTFEATLVKLVPADGAQCFACGHLLRPWSFFDVAEQQVMIACSACRTPIAHIEFGIIEVKEDAPEHVARRNRVLQVIARTDLAALGASAEVVPLHVIHKEEDTE